MQKQIETSLNGAKDGIVFTPWSIMPLKYGELSGGVHESPHSRYVPRFMLLHSLDNSVKIVLGVRRARNRDDDRTRSSAAWILNLHAFHACHYAQPRDVLPSCDE